MSSARIRPLVPLLGWCVFSFALVFAVGGVSSRTTQSFHGLHHSAYVVQIANGIVPPTNPSSMGAAVDFYWAWHALLARGVSLFGVTPFEMGLFSNALGLSALLCSLWLAARKATANALVRVGFCLLPFFILNPVGLCQFAGRLLGVLLPAWIHALVEGNPEAGEHLRNLAQHHESLRIANLSLLQLLPRFDFLEGVALSGRAGNLLNKFFNFNSFPLALGIFAAGILGLRGEPRSLLSRAGLVGFAALTTAILSPLVAAGLGCVVAAYLIVQALEGYRQSETLAATELRSWALRRLSLAIAALAGVMLALPHLLPIMRAYGGETNVYADGSKLLAHARYVGWGLLPSLALQLAALTRFRRLCPDARVHLLSGLFLALAAILLAVPVEDPNEYKLVLLSTLPTTLLAMTLWRHWEAKAGFESAGGQRLRWVVGSLLSLAGAVAILVTVMMYQLSPWATSDPYHYKGERIELSTGPDDPSRVALAAGYRWLRENTDPEAFVMEMPVSKDELELSVIAERRVVAALPSPFTLRIAYQQRLVKQVAHTLARLSECRLDARDLSTLHAVPAPWPEHVYAFVLQERFKHRGCPEGLVAGVRLEFSNDRVAIYRLARPAG